MREYEDFLDEVMPHVPGCQTDVALLALRNTAIDFCTRTLLIQEQHDPVTTLAGQRDYDFDTYNGQRVCRIMWAAYGGERLTPLPFDQLPVRDTDGLPIYIYQLDELSFSLYPLPQVGLDQGLTMRVALKPARDSTVCADALYDDWLEFIAAGALARLHLSLNKPYTDAASGNMRAAQYASGVSRARIEVNRAYTRSDMRVQPRAFI